MDDVSIGPPNECSSLFNQDKPLVSTPFAAASSAMSTHSLKVSERHIRVLDDVICGYLSLMFSLMRKDG